MAALYKSNQEMEVMMNDAQRRAQDAESNARKLEDLLSQAQRRPVKLERSPDGPFSDGDVDMQVMTMNKKEKQPGFDDDADDEGDLDDEVNSPLLLGILIFASTMILE